MYGRSCQEGAWLGLFGLVVAAGLEPANTTLKGWSLEPLCIRDQTGGLYYRRRKAQRANRANAAIGYPNSSQR